MSKRAACTWIVGLSLFVTAHGCSKKLEAESPASEMEAATPVAIVAATPSADGEIKALVAKFRAITEAHTAGERKAAYAAGDQLAKHSKAGMEALIDQLTHDDTRIRQAALACIPGGEAGKPAIWELARCLEDKDPEIRFGAAKCLQAIGRPAEGMRGAVKSALQTERNSFVRVVLEDVLKKTEPEEVKEPE